MVTNEQLKILCLVRAGHRTFRGIAEAMGLEYHSGVHKQVETLRQAGLVERDPALRTAGQCIDTTATLRLTGQGRQAIEGYFLTYKTGGGVELERMVRRYNRISGIDSGLAGRTRTGA